MFSLLLLLLPTLYKASALSFGPNLDLVRSQIQKPVTWILHIVYLSDKTLSQAMEELYNLVQIYTGRHNLYEGLSGTNSRLEQAEKSSRNGLLS